MKKVWTTEEYREYERTRTIPGEDIQIQRRSRPSVQKHKKHICEKQKTAPFHRSKETETNDRDNPIFAIFCLRVSDNRRRDLDGAKTTVLDCLVRAGAVSDDRLGIISGGIDAYSKGEEGFDLILVEKI